MTKTITAVPENITRAQYVTLIESLGFNANDLRRMEFAIDGIWAEVVSRDNNGKLITTGTALAKHRVHIPIVDRPTPADWNAPAGQPVTVNTDLR